MNTQALLLMHTGAMEIYFVTVGINGIHQTSLILCFLSHRPFFHIMTFIKSILNTLESTDTQGNGWISI